MKVLYSYSMGKWILVLVWFAVWAAASARAGDEDVKQEAPQAVPQEESPFVPDDKPEVPDLALDEEPEPVSPEYVPPPVKQAKPTEARSKWNPDKNLDYSELLGFVDTLEAGAGVLPPALGVRGYRPNLIGVSYGDRTPGYGLLMEYSWNRLSAGVSFAYRDLNDDDPETKFQTLGGLYALYRWLPFSFSPYILLGLELGSKTPDAFGGMLGLGMEARVYSGWTLLLGYTHHSAMRKGFFGGGAGWSF